MGFELYSFLSCWMRVQRAKRLYAVGQQYDEQYWLSKHKMWNILSIVRICETVRWVYNRRPTPHRQRCWETGGSIAGQYGRSAGGQGGGERGGDQYTGGARSRKRSDVSDGASSPDCSGIARWTTIARRCLRNEVERGSPPPCALECWHQSGCRPCFWGLFQIFREKFFLKAF